MRGTEGRIERYGITNIPVLKYFIKRVIENITNPLSVNKIYNELKSQGYKVGKNSLYEFLEEAESIYLFLTDKKYSESVLKQELGEKKTYVIDNGLLNAVTFKFSKDHGKLLENLIYLELRRKYEEIFFYKDRKECDFITFRKSQINHILQASYSIADPQREKREIAGLVETCKRLNSRKGYIVTFEEERNIEEQGIFIKVIPAYKFLLEIL